MKKKYVLLIVIFLFLGHFFYYLNSGTSRKVQDGTIQYTKEIGWINWGHAKPESTSKYWEEFQNVSSESIDSFLFSYSQKMKYDLGKNYFVVEYREQRKFRPLLDEQEEKSAFLEMFFSVSNGFEKLQGKFPYVLFGSNASSYRDGDLTGNLISYFLAINEIKKKELKTYLTLEDKTSSYFKYQEEGIGKTDWSSLEWKDSTKNKLVGELQKILKENNSAESYSRIIAKTETGYFE